MKSISRRSLLRNSAATVSCAVLAPFALPLPSKRAQAAVTLATVSAGFNLAAGLLGFMNRGANPTIPLLISIADAVEALGIKIDAIDNKLDVIVGEIAQLRAEVQQIPYKTNLQEVLGEMREPWDAFVERSRGVNLENPSNTFLNDLRPTLERLQVARRKFIRLSGTGADRSFEGVADLALAQDAEIAIGTEAMRPEMFDRGEEVDATAFRSSLKVYREYFEGALDSSNPNSLPAMKAHYRVLAEKILGRKDGEQSAFEKALRSESSENRSVQCKPYIFTCLQFMNRGQNNEFCSEPGDRPIQEISQSIPFTYKKSAEVPPSLGRAPDELSLPHFFGFAGRGNCENTGRFTHISFVSPEVESAVKQQVADLNQKILPYYRLQYAQEIAVEALEINRRIEAQLAAQMDI